MARARVEFPLREFMFTLDQIAMLLSVDESRVRSEYIFFDGVTTGSYRTRMRARNIAPDNSTPDWRVTESQFKNFLRRKGYSIVEPELLG